MSQPYYEVFREISATGIHLAYRTLPGGYHPIHWHEEVELLYLLNGDADITIEGKKYRLPPKNLIVIDSCQMHSSYSRSAAYMFACIHISPKLLQKYLPDIGLYRFCCHPEEIAEDKRPAYQKICSELENLIRLYVKEPPAFLMESEGIIMQILAQLIRDFTDSKAPKLPKTGQTAMERLRSLITYVEEHYSEPISLTEAADLLGLGPEYFCRFFKKHMGMSFLHYVNEVRAAHIYQALLDTDLPVAELAEQNGFTNQKLFNRTFKEIYGCTPSSVRKTR